MDASVKVVPQYVTTKKFNSFSDMEVFEACMHAHYANRQFLMNRILDFIVPKRHRLHRKYEQYLGGWYLDENGTPCARGLTFFDQNALREGETVWIIENSITLGLMYVQDYKYLGHNKFQKVQHMIHPIHEGTTMIARPNI